MQPQPTRAEIVNKIRNHIGGTEYVPASAMRELADRIETEGIAPDPCRGDECPGCPGCPECSVSRAELVADAIPQETAVHIHATNTGGTLVLNAVIDIKAWEKFRADGKVGPLVELLGPVWCCVGAEYRLDLPRPECCRAGGCADCPDPFASSAADVPRSGSPVPVGEIIEALKGLEYYAPAQALIDPRGVTADLHARIVAHGVCS